MMAHTEIIIVGAGPVGLMLAGELRLGGADVVVLERLPEPTGESRASILHARTMEIFDRRGLLASLGSPPYDAMGHFAGIPLDLSALPTAYPGQWKVPQARTEQLLHEWAQGLGADIRRGHEVRGLAQTADHAEVEAVTPGNGVLRLRAQYVVGCDGEGSAVRQLAGIAFPGHDANKELLRVDVTGVRIRDRRFARSAGGIANAARRDDGVTRLMVHEFGVRPRSRDGAVYFADIARTWARVTGEDISAATPLWTNAFGNVSRQAERYRHGRVLLAGDAAHAQLPVGGQALNLGLQDAVCLGNKLAAVVCGTAGTELLDRYHDERHRAGARTLANIGAQALLLFGGPEVEAVHDVFTELLRLEAVRDHLAGTITGLDQACHGTGPQLAEAAARSRRLGVTP